MSSSSSSSESEGAPSKTVVSKSIDESNSDSDFVDDKKDRKKKFSNVSTELHQSTPLQNAGSRLSFQKVLMGSNSKFAELLKSKKSLPQNNFTSPSPVKGILKTGKDKVDNKNTLKTDLDFNPVASSTQLEQTRMSNSKEPLDESSSSSEEDTNKALQKSRLSLSKSMKTDQIKQRTKEVLSNSESSSSDTDDHAKIHDRDVNKSKTKLGKESVGDRDSSTDTKRVKSKQDTKIKTHKQSLDSESPSKLKKVQQRGRGGGSSSSEESNEHRHKMSSHKKNKKSSNNSSDSDDNNHVVKKSKQKKKQNRGSDSSTSEDDNRVVKKSKQDQDSSSSTSEDDNRVADKFKQKKKLMEVDSPKVKHSSKATLQLKQFEADHKSLLKVDEHYKFLNKIKPNEEMFIVQIPKSLNPKDLIGTKISVSEKTRVPEKSRKYDSLPSHTTQEAVPVFTNLETLQFIKPSGNIKIQRHIKSKQVSDIPGSWNNHVAFPDNLKQRHPLFGADYSNKINLEDHVQEKLKAAIESYTKQKNKKKKKKKHKNKGQEEISGQKEEEIFKYLNLSETKEDDASEIKKKKNKNIVEPKSSKKKKKQVEEMDVVDTLEVSAKSKKKRKIKDEGNDSPKKKQRKEKENPDESMKLITEMLLSKSLQFLNPKEKKKRKSSYNSTNEDQASTSVTKKKKHKKHKEIE